MEKASKATWKKQRIIIEKAPQHGKSNATWKAPQHHKGKTAKTTITRNTTKTTITRNTTKTTITRNTTKTKTKRVQHQTRPRPNGTKTKRDQDQTRPRLSQSKEIQPVQRETQPGSPKRLSLSSGKSKHRNMDKHAP